MNLTKGYAKTRLCNYIYLITNELHQVCSPFWKTFYIQYEEYNSLIVNKLSESLPRCAPLGRASANERQVCQKSLNNLPIHNTVRTNNTDDTMADTSLLQPQMSNIQKYRPTKNDEHKSSGIPIVQTRSKIFSNKSFIIKIFM